MNLVVDANVIVAALIKDSTTRRLLANPALSLYSPDFLFEELTEHEAEISKKAGLDSVEFTSLLDSISKFVKVVNRAVYENYLVESADVVKDPDDVAYLALALALSGCGVWSHDKNFLSKSQELFTKFSIKVFTTNDLVLLVKV